MGTVDRAPLPVPLPAPLPAPPPALHYRIRIQGRLDARWSHWFDGMSISYADALGETVLFGLVPDQTALHGLLAKIRDLNLDLISLERSSTT